MSSEEAIGKAVIVGGVRHVKQKQSHPNTDNNDTTLQTSLVQGLDPNPVVTDEDLGFNPKEKPDAPAYEHKPSKQPIQPKHSKMQRAHHQVKQPMPKTFGGGK